MAGRLQREAWWEEIRHQALPEYLSFIKAEAQATHIDSYYSFALPGLLQTELYARAVSTATATFMRSYKRFDQTIRIRMLRQWHVLEGEFPPTLHFVVDETVLYRPFGGEACLRDALRHVLALMELPQLTFRVLPITACTDMLFLEAGFSIMSGTGNLLFTESLFGDKVQTDPIVRLQYQDYFEQLSAHALNIEQSRALLTKTIARLDAGEPMQLEVAPRVD